MHEDIDWMDRSDHEIVLEVAAHMGWIRPASLALNLPYEESHIAVRCQTLARHGLLAQHPTAIAYELSALGGRFLFQHVSVDELTSVEDGATDADASGTTFEYTDE